LLLFRGVLIRFWFSNDDDLSSKPLPTALVTLNGCYLVIMGISARLIVEASGQAPGTSANADTFDYLFPSHLTFHKATSVGGPITHHLRRHLIPVEVGAHVGASFAAGRADEPRDSMSAVLRADIHHTSGKSAWAKGRWASMSR
jgi:hypothetical protein